MRRLVVVLCILACAWLTVGGAQAAQSEGKEAALALLEQGSFKAAAEAFKALGDEPDAYDYMLYASARDFEHGGYFDHAGALYGLLDGFLDSNDRLGALVIDERMYAYQSAAKLEELGDIHEAGAAFLKLGDYMDSRQRADALLAAEAEMPDDPAEIYAMAEQFEADGDLLSAFAHYAMIADYQDALVRGMSCHIRWQEQTYAAAESAEAAGDAEQAMELFAALSDYRDSAERAAALGWDAESEQDPESGQGTETVSPTPEPAPTPEPESETAPVWLYPYYDEQTGLYGYMDGAGNGVLEPQWDAAGPFYQELAWVRKDRKYGYIWLDGEQAYDLIFDDAGNFTQGTARVKMEDGLAVVTVEGEILRGLDSVSEPPSEGMRVIKKDGLYGYAGSGGRFIQPEWDMAWDFSEGLAAVRGFDLDEYGFGMCGYINTDGELVIPYVLSWDNPFQGGLVYASYADTRASGGVRKGYIDATGKMVMPGVPMDGIGCGGFSDDLALCYSDGGFYYLNRQGGKAINGPFKNAEAFENGHAVVTHPNGDVELIGVDGRSLSRRYQAIGKFVGGLASAKQDGRYGFIDEGGALAIPAAYDSVVYGHLDGLALVLLDGERLYIDRQGGVVRRWSLPEPEPTPLPEPDYIYVPEDDADDAQSDDGGLDPATYFFYGGELYSEFSFKALKKGDKGELVKAAQKRLIELKFLGGAADGSFGSATQQAVYDFQDWNGLEWNGKLDYYTMWSLLAGYPDAYQEADFCVQLASYASWEMSGSDKMKFKVQVNNWSKNRTVKSVKLNLLCKDSNGLSVGDYMYFKTLNVTVKPGKTVYVPAVTFSGRKKIRKIECGISSVTFTNGSTVYADDVDYSTWDIGW